MNPAWVAEQIRRCETCQRECRDLPEVCEHAQEVIDRLKAELPEQRDGDECG